MKNVITLEQLSAFIREISDLYDNHSCFSVELNFNKFGNPKLHQIDYADYLGYDDHSDYICDFFDVLASYEEDKTILLPKEEVLKQARENLEKLLVENQTPEKKIAGLQKELHELVEEIKTLIRTRKFLHEEEEQNIINDILNDKYERKFEILKQISFLSNH